MGRESLSKLVKWIKSYVISFIVWFIILVSFGCKSLVPNFYAPTIWQGNYIDQTVINHIYVGMNKYQLQHILGTPLIIDPFHQKRWDYYFQISHGKKLNKQHCVTLFFRDDILNRLEIN